MSAQNPAAQKTAVLHRMVMPDHVCPYGRKSLWLLRRKGYAVQDHHLKTREETDAFKAVHGVRTTPQTFIDGVRIGGHDDLRRYFGEKVPEPGATSYTPVLVVFAAAALIALAVAFLRFGTPFDVSVLPSFIAAAMVLLAMLKLQDVEKFSTMFLNYDLLAQRWPPYGYLYPFAELGAGVLMLAGVLTWLSAPVALFIGGIGAVSVFKAVYVDKRELKCACVGGSSNVPLGFVSLTENLMMIGMAVWMLAGPAAGRIMAASPCAKESTGPRPAQPPRRRSSGSVSPRQCPRPSAGPASIHTAMAIIIRFSVRETKPSGTLDEPPTQAHFSSRLST